MLFAVSGCSAKQTLPEGQVVEAVGSDYAFQVPEKINAGPTVFHFVNKGKVRHEVDLFMLTRGTTMQQYPDRRKQQKPTQDLIDGPIGVLVAGSGSSSDAGLSADLIPGRDPEVDLLSGREYKLACLFSDSTNAPPHIALGMYGRICVTSSPGN